MLPVTSRHAPTSDSRFHFPLLGRSRWRRVVAGVIPPGADADGTDVLRDAWRGDYARADDDPRAAAADHPTFSASTAARGHRAVPRRRGWQRRSPNAPAAPAGIG